MRLLATAVLLSGMLLVGATAAATFELHVAAPPSLAAAADRVRNVEPGAIEAALAGAGLALPSGVRVTLIAEHDPQARDVPHWVVGLASGTEDVVIFPQRVGSYPYGSLESVLEHELAHLALTRQAGGRRLPRWFHEGVAVSVESGWGLEGGARLLFAALSAPRIDDLGDLFASDTQLGSSEAYLLAAALVTDVRERHGPAVPGAIATHVARGVPFERAFALETGETPDAAAARARSGYRRWTSWLPLLTGGTSLWSGIVVLALVAIVVQRRRRARRRRAWDDEAPAWPDGPA